MVDTRFHSFSGPQSLAQLLGAIGLSPNFAGEGPLVEGAEELHLAGAQHVSLAAHTEYREALLSTGAGVVVVSEDLAADVPTGALSLVVTDPHGVFVALLEQLYPANTRS